MLENWNDAIVTDIELAIFVEEHMSKHIHNNRPFHGFVINTDTSDKVIHFSDGTDMRTGPNEVHYLPKGSHYRVEKLVPGGCWAINFDLLQNISEKPFNIKFRNHESILKDFKTAVDAWKQKNDAYNAVIRKCIYNIIIKIKEEQQRNYVPGSKEVIIKPAIDTINREFTNNNLSIKELAKLCGISEAYLRRIFIDKYGLSPKEYITNLRIEYAKKLIESKQFSVGEVACMCGYFEPCHFSREFKKHVGITPIKYKK